MKIQVKSLPLKEVVHDIANAFGTVVKEECEVYSMKIPRRFGSGIIKGVNFKNGLGYIKYECKFNINIELHFTINDVHPAKFLYVTEGSLRHCFSNEDESHQINKYQSAIVASSEKNGHILTFQKNIDYSIDSIEINRSHFLEEIACDLSKMNDGLSGLFKDIAAANTFYHEGSYSLKLADILKTREGYDHKGLEKRIYLTGVTYLVLTEQILMYHEDSLDPGKQNILRKGEVENIKTTIATITENLMEYTSIKSISEKIGINENKLRSGFKLLYGKTISDYFKDVRLEKASHLLRDSEYSIAEIVSQIGLSSGGYFSQMFKERYGFTPNQFRKMANS